MAAADASMPWKGLNPDDSLTQEFRLTEHHLKLLQRMYVGWSDADYGAPAIDPQRPYGNRDVEGDMCEILGLAMLPDPEHMESWIFPVYNRAAAASMHHEMMDALQIVLCTQSFRLGLYRRTAAYNRRAWQWVSE